MNSNIRAYLIYCAWLFAAVATAGSLFFSEIMKLPPCVLCWYQRIAMYPLVLIFTVSILRRDVMARVYGIPLALCGFVIAIYHNLLYYKIMPQAIIPCTSGVSCTSRQIEWLGFITIPFLSLTAFIAILLCLFFYKPNQTGARNE